MSFKDFKYLSKDEKTLLILLDKHSRNKLKSSLETNIEFFIYKLLTTSSIYLNNQPTCHYKLYKKVKTEINLPYLHLLKYNNKYWGFNYGTLGFFLHFLNVQNADIFGMSELIIQHLRYQNIISEIDYIFDNIKIIKDLYKNYSKVIDNSLSEIELQVNKIFIRNLIDPRKGSLIFNTTPLEWNNLYSEILSYRPSDDGSKIYNLLQKLKGSPELYRKYRYKIINSYSPGGFNLFILYECLRLILEYKETSNVEKLNRIKSYLNSSNLSSIRRLSNYL